MSVLVILSRLPMTVVTRLQLVLWDQDCACDRKWLLKNVQGATAIIVMVADKVRVNRSAYQPGHDLTFSR